MKRTRKNIYYIVVLAILLPAVYTLCSECSWNDVYLPNFGDGSKKHIWTLEELQEAGKDFQIQKDGTFLSESSDPWFMIEETFDVQTIRIDIGEINDNSYSQIFYYSADPPRDSEYFQLKRGANYLQIPKGSCHTFRLDLTDNANINLALTGITTYGNRIIPAGFWMLVTVIWIILAVSIHTLFFRPETVLQELFPGIVLSFSFSFLLCIFAPIEQYLNNWQEFWFDLYRLLPIMFAAFLLFFVAGGSLMTVFYRIHKKVYQAGIAVGFILFLCTYIQGNFLVTHLPPLDGTDIVWDDYASGRIESIILWCVATILILFILKIIHTKKFYRLVCAASIGIVTVLGITLATVGITSNGLKHKLDISVTLGDQFDMSKDSNFIILLLDAVDSGTFGEVMEENPESEKSFSDFTYYPNTLGGYPYTSRSIPFILSGDWFENQEPFENYVENVYKNSRLFAQLEELDFEMSVYDDSIPNTDKSIYRFNNVLENEIQISSVYSFAKKELLLTGFKYAPFDFKRFCVVTSNDFQFLRKQMSKYETAKFWNSNQNFYTNILETDISYTNQKCFKFIHLERAHVPLRYDKDVSVIKDGTYKQSVEACYTIISAYLNKLRASGVYDNSIIIIMSDHGFNGNSIHGRQNPILMVKGFHEEHELQISNAPLSFADLSEAYTRLLDEKTGSDVFDWQEGDVRERRYLWYEYLQENYMVEYTQVQNADDTEAMLPTGRIFEK